ncbi:DUF1697 domain-containing protein [Formosa sp. A9]|uniref:DUF1697 domain-containing protein n=1 Tax=Formosa sp. A9 TaxID=3442641 RepID=UPI003EB87AEB
MEDLRILLKNLGYHNVKTYIQSGNVMFQSETKANTDLALEIQKELFNYFQFEVPVLVKTLEELQAVFEANPFEDSKRLATYFTLLHSKPDITLISQVQAENYPGETFAITPECVYFYSETGYGKAKCNNNFFERKLKVSATTRNFKTMQKLLSLCSDF